MVCRIHLPAVVRRCRGQLAAGAVGLILMVTGCAKGPVVSPETSRSGEPRLVQTAKATRQAVTRTVVAIGELVAREDATLSVKVSGRLHRIEVDLGDSVALGQLLAQVEPRDYELELRQAEAFLAQARARLGLPLHGQQDDVDPAETSTVQQARARLVEAQLNRERFGKLAEQGILAQSELEAAEAAYEVAANVHRNALEEANNRLAQLLQRKVEVEIAQKRLVDSSVLAPFAGTVLERRASVGEYLPVGTPILTLVATDPLRLRLEVSEREAGAVRAGQPVRILTDGQPTDYTGAIRRVSPSIDSTTRMLKVEADVPNDGSLRPGAFVQAQITVAQAENTITVPSRALVTFAGIEKVFVIEAGKAVERNVTTGRRHADWVELVHGLGDGELVILNPGNLQTGQSVRIESAPAAADPST
ncbi:MAG: efflux RND transporter periplasmic adaptor subunit [Verrucomicrobia bacterium]|nr:efflux RND transporter periplasmic adaptor subunit [Verrucomicrobiota bacterium]